MFIAGLGTAVPPQCYTQRECWDAMRDAPQFSALKPRSRAILKKILCGENGIRSRHLALDSLSDVFETGPDALQSRFARNAPALAVQAARRALKDARCRPEELDALLISTCTGYLCPGLTSYVSGRLDLRKNIIALDLVGQGCGAALPNLRMAGALLAAGRARKALSICVEVCSAAFYLDDDPGVLVSACLFGDGAGAAVLTNEHSEKKRRVKWNSGFSTLQPEKRNLLRFSHKDGMLRNILSLEIPQIAGKEAEKLLSASLAGAGVRREQITGWILHAGGRDVMLALRNKLKLRASDVRHSTAVLREFGNISSPSVLFVLEQALRDTVPDGLWWISSFGAGFSCHGALLEVG